MPAETPRPSTAGRVVFGAAALGLAAIEVKLLFFPAALDSERWIEIVALILPIWTNTTYVLGLPNWPANWFPPPRVRRIFRFVVGIAVALLLSFGALVLAALGGFPWYLIVVGLVMATLAVWEVLAHATGIRSPSDRVRKWRGHEV